MFHISMYGFSPSLPDALLASIGAMGLAATTPLVFTNAKYVASATGTASSRVAKQNNRKEQGPAENHAKQ